MSVRRLLRSLPQARLRKSDAMRGLHHAAHRPVVTLPKRRKPEGRSRSGDRGVLPHTATKGFARSYRINLRLLPELAFSSEHDVRFSQPYKEQVGDTPTKGLSIQKPEKPKWNATAAADFYAIHRKIAVRQIFYLLE